MKLKELVKSYGFWTALAGALVVLVQALGGLFGFKVENQLISDIVMAVAGVLVVFGVVAMPKPHADSLKSSENTNQEIEENNKTQDDEK